jgi:hypothetical protein
LLRLTTSKKLLLDVVVIRGDCGENKSEHAESGERDQQRIVVMTEVTRTAGAGSLRFGCALRVVGYRIHAKSRTSAYDRGPMFFLRLGSIPDQGEYPIASGGVALPSGLERAGNCSSERRVWGILRPGRVEVNINKKAPIWYRGIWPFGSLYWRLAPPLLTGRGWKLRSLSHSRTWRFENRTFDSIRIARRSNVTLSNDAPPRNSVCWETKPPLKTEWPKSTNLRKMHWRNSTSVSNARLQAGKRL